MRASISIIVSLLLFVSVFYLSYSENFKLPDYWTGLAILLTATAISVLAWGIKPSVESFLSKKNRTQDLRTPPSSLKLENEIEEKKDVSINFTSFGITNKFLDEIYKQARLEAVQIYDDASLSRFSILFHPYENGGIATIFLCFYSKFADRICKFSSYSMDGFKLTHDTPDEYAKFDLDRKRFDTLPWKKSPHWMDFINRYYTKVGPITPTEKSRIHLSTTHFSEKKGYDWALTISDGFTGRRYCFQWNGGKINDQNVREKS